MYASCMLQPVSGRLLFIINEKQRSGGASSRFRYATRSRGLKKLLKNRFSERVVKV